MMKRSMFLPVFLAASLPAFLLLGIALVPVDASAIVIRHDTGYAMHSARESEFPAVFYLEQRQQRRICVATLIHPRWALTAAHCTEETTLGATLASGQDYPVTIARQPRLVDQIVLHPSYPANPDGVEVDLALLRLSDPLEMPRPVPLYTRDDEQNQAVTLVGWGFFGIGTQGIQVDDGRFRQATNIIETASHRLRFVFDDPRESDALPMEGVPGLGDSGGPALLPGHEGWELAGVAVGELDRAQKRQGQYGAVAIYERISLHLNWISSVIGEGVGENSD